MNFGTLDPDLRKIVRIIEMIRKKLIKINKCKDKKILEYIALLILKFLKLNI